MKNTSSWTNLRNRRDSQNSSQKTPHFWGKNGRKLYPFIPLHYEFLKTSFRYCKTPLLIKQRPGESSLWQNGPRKYQTPLKAQKRLEKPAKKHENCPNARPYQIWGSFTWITMPLSGAPNQCPLGFPGFSEAISCPQIAVTWTNFLVFLGLRCLLAYFGWRFLW